MKEIREGLRVGRWIWVGLCADECTGTILVKVYMPKMKMVGGKINDIRCKRACQQEGFETYIRLIKAVCRTGYKPDFWCRTKWKVCYISRSTYISEILRKVIVTCGCQLLFPLFFRPLQMAVWTYVMYILALMTIWVSHEESWWDHWISGK